MDEGVRGSNLAASIFLLSRSLLGWTSNQSFSGGPPISEFRKCTYVGQVRKDGDDKMDGKEQIQKALLSKILRISEI